MEMTPFTITQNKIKYAGVNAKSASKDLLDENLKSFKNEIEEDIRR